MQSPVVTGTHISKSPEDDCSPSNIDGLRIQTISVRMKVQQYPTRSALGQLISKEAARLAKGNRQERG